MSETDELGAYSGKEVIDAIIPQDCVYDPRKIILPENADLMEDTVGRVTVFRRVLDSPRV